MKMIVDVDGDRSVGDLGGYATVDFGMCLDGLTADDLRCVKETLADAFRQIYDGTRASVWTEEEWQKYQQQEQG